MPGFNYSDATDGDIVKKITFLNMLVSQSAVSSKLHALLDALDQRVSSIQVVFVEPQTVTTTSIDTLYIPRSIPLEDTLICFIKLLCFFERAARMPLVGHDSADSYADAMLHLHYDSSQRAIDIAIDFIKKNRQVLQNLLTNEHITDTPDDIIGELLQEASITRPDYIQSLQELKQYYQQDWDTRHTLERQIRHHQQELAALSVSMAESKTTLRQLKKDIGSHQQNYFQMNTGIRFFHAEAINIVQECAAADWSKVEPQLLQLFRQTMGRPSPSRYLFAQQRDATCMLMPFINLSILKQQLGHDGRVRLFDRTWRTKQEWLSKTFPGIRAWHQAMRRLSFPDSGMPRAFADYQAHLLRTGLVEENIPDLVGLAGLSWQDMNDSKAALKKCLYTPYTSRQSMAWSMLSKTLPLYADGGQFYLYDPKSKWYETLHPEPGVTPTQSTILTRQLRIPRPLMAYYDLDDSDVLFPSGPAFGHEQHYRVSWMGKKGEYSSYFYSAGLYQLILFGMGLDRANQDIQAGHPLFDAYQAFTTDMNQDDNNPWHAKNFNKNNLFEYHVAQLFLEQPALKEKFKHSVSSFTPWPYYQMLDSLADGEQFKQALPGDDQMLAYAVSKNLKALWAMSLSREKFMAVHDMDSLNHEELAEINIDNLMVEIKTEATQLIDGACFLDHWDTLRIYLEQRVGKQASLVSFDGHGSIKSFNPTLCYFQEQQGLADSPLYHRLAYTEIDSFYDQGRQPFYKRTAHETEKMEKAALHIQSFWRSHVKREGPIAPVASCSYR